MIIYATKETIDRLHIPLFRLNNPLNDSSFQALYDNQFADPLLEWGIKLFYFNRRKCIQVMNFASKFSLFIIDLKVDDVHRIPLIMAQYLFELYRQDPRMLMALRDYFINHADCLFMRLSNRSIISSLNHNQSDFAWDGQAFYDYIKNGTLQTVEINHRLNFDWYVTQSINGKTEYILPGERFRTLMLERYADHQPKGSA